MSELGSTFNTPASFFVFEQDLLQFANNVVKRSILRFDECIKIGVRLNMTSEMVEAALILFHRQNTFLYFRHVLPDHVFINPQVPLDIVNGIVRFRYKKLHCVPANIVCLFEDGIITENLLSHDEISHHIQKGFYEVKDAIKLFCHTFTLAPLELNKITQPDDAVDDKNKKYLMMCLKPTIPDQELHHYIPKSSETVPLVVKFSSGCVPLGCFGSTISCLISKYGWEVVRKDGVPKCLAHNIACLHDPNLLVNVVIVDFSQYLEIHIDSHLHDCLPKICGQVHSKVFGSVEYVFSVMKLDTDVIKISSVVLCTSCSSASEKHFAEFVNWKGEYWLRCNSKYHEPNEKQLSWMGIYKEFVFRHPIKPTLPLLQRFPTQSGGAIKIIERIGASKNHDLGICLLNDDHGALTGIIEAQYKRDPPTRATEAILQKWLLGTGRTPQSWHTLI